MKIGASIYCLYQALLTKRCTVPAAIQILADAGAQCVEWVQFVADLEQDEALLNSVVAELDRTGMTMSAYSVFSNVLDLGLTERTHELKRLFAQVDLAKRMGAPILRSDFTKWGRPFAANVIENYMRDLPQLVSICREVSDYAESQGIIFTVENHGTYINGGDRVRLLVESVERKNFRCTLDVGNGLCVDEEPLSTLKTLLPYAATIHFKDFLIRRESAATGAGGPAAFAVAAWLTTNAGNYLRGTVVGDGDVPVVQLMNEIQLSGYSGSVVIEFEGREEPIEGTKSSMQNLLRYAASAKEGK
jgi:sugar phosphate isomerase/epimerase